MREPRVLVVGAGLSGLSTAVKLASVGARVEVFEAATQAGGRCRSYYDSQLGLTIDNGNHLVLSGNRAVHDYLALIGSTRSLAGPDTAEFAFVDVRSMARWTVRPNDGRLPWWVLSQARRPPGTRPKEFVRLRGLMHANPGLRVDEVMQCSGALWDRLIHPFLLAALNTEPQASSADLASSIIRQTLAKGGQAYRPRIATSDLSATFIEPALRTLENSGATLQLGRRLRSLQFDDHGVSSLGFSDGEVRVAPEDQVVLATPAWISRDLVPGLKAPDTHRAIVNAHFRLTPPTGFAPMLGVIGGVVEWIFTFKDRISVTISAADRLVDVDRQTLAALLWRDVATALDLGPDPPPWQVVKEKRATFAATPEQDALRPGVQTRWSNLILAGDWVQTGLPSTIEGALRSAEQASQLATKRLFV